MITFPVGDLVISASSIEAMMEYRTSALQLQAGGFLAVGIPLAGGEECRWVFKVENKLDYSIRVHFSESFPNAEAQGFAVDTQGIEYGELQRIWKTMLSSGHQNRQYVKEMAELARVARFEEKQAWEQQGGVVVTFVSKGERTSWKAMTDLVATARVVTNRPEAIIRLGEPYVLEEKLTRNDRFERETLERKVARDMFIDPKKLGADGYVGSWIQVSFDGNGKRSKKLSYDHLYGVEKATENFDWPSAFAVWAEEVREEAYFFLLGQVFSRQNGGRLERKLRYASNWEMCTPASFDSRFAAWQAVVKALSNGTKTLEKGSIRTMEARVAKWFGHKASKPQPEYWEGLPKGVTVIQ